MRPGFFPLDDELALLPGALTPRLQESLVRLGTLLPSFALAAAELAFHTGVEVDRTTATRLSEAAGAAAVAVQEAEVATILRDYPQPPTEPERLVLHVDGAMVPLRHGAWGEVKTLAVGLYGIIDSDRSNNLGIFAAGALLTAIPVIALFQYLQKYIVGGITAGGVKG